MNLSRIGLLALALLSLPARGAAPPAEENPVIDLEALAPEGTNLRIATPAALPLHVDRRAGRVLDVLAAGQVLTVLAMDRFGLQVRGRGKNGLLTGWVGQKKALGGDAKQLAKLQAFYERQLEIEAHVARKRPALGMNLAELKRILGKPTNHLVDTTEDGRIESLTWIIKEKLDLNELLSAATDEDLLRMEVEVGRIEISLSHGLASSIKMNLDQAGGDIPTVVPPIKDPLGPAPVEKIAGQ